MARIAHIIQLIVSLSIVGLFWLIYPGVMVLFAGVLGLVYVAAAIGALRGSLIAGRIALGFSIATALLGALAVHRFIGNGFSYVSGNFPPNEGIYWPPYIFLAIAVCAALVVGLQFLMSYERRSKLQT